ncbi:MAG: TerB family tellurite resistance protein [Cellulosilyticaceae bacterium]
MGLGKVILGATIGVGAIAAAPFTGGGSLFAGASLAASLAGAGTIAAAVGAGVAGAVAGVVANEMEEGSRNEERTAAKADGFEDGLKKGEENVKAEVNRVLNDIKKRDDFLIGLTAFCYAVANCDGEIASAEMDELDYYLNIIKINSTLSPAVKGELTRVKNNKADFKNITNKLDKIDVEDLSSFTEILESIISADNQLSPEEVQIRNEWNEYYGKRQA